MTTGISDTERLDAGADAMVMGILNVTPDSFSDGGAFLDAGDALRHVSEMLSDGADIIDIGGESTRPGYRPVDADEELRRVLPIVRAAVREHPGICISIDTCKPEVAARCLDAGARIVNDISGLAIGGVEMCRVLSEYRADCVLMHPRGADDGCALEQVRRHLSALLDYAMEKSGLPRGHFVLDPGIGFGKSVEENARLSIASDELHALGCPVMIGVSRKSFIGAITGRDVKERQNGTAAAEAIAVFHGADILRTHDVRAARDAARIGMAMRRAYNNIETGG